MVCDVKWVLFLCPNSHRIRRIHRKLLPPIRQLALVVEVPTVQGLRRGDDITFVVPFTATGDGADYVKAVDVRGGDEFTVFIEQTSSLQGSQAGGFIGEAEHGGHQYHGFFSCYQCVGHGSEEIYWVMFWRVSLGNLAGQ